MSLAGVMSWPSTDSSGAAKPWVPMPARVRMPTVLVSPRGQRTMPQSATAQRPSRSRTLEGLMSRWIHSLRCASARPAATAPTRACRWVGSCSTVRLSSTAASASGMTNQSWVGLESRTGMTCGLPPNRRAAVTSRRIRRASLSPLPVRFLKATMVPVGLCSARKTSAWPFCRARTPRSRTVLESQCSRISGRRAGAALRSCL